MAKLKAFFNPENLKTIDTTIKADSIPNMLPADQMKILLEGESDPYYFVEAIKYGKDNLHYAAIEYGENGWVPQYSTKGFWESYLDVLKTRPIGGSKRGHDSFTSDMTPDNDLYIVGGRVDKDTVYLKHFVPKEHDNTIRDIKLGLHELSIVSELEYSKHYSDGELELIELLKSTGGQRNDLLPVGEGGMENKIVANRNKTGEDNMNYEEMLEKLAAGIPSGKITSAKIASSLGLTLYSNEHKEELEAAKTELSVMTARAEKAEAVTQDVKETDFNNKLTAALDEKFGAEKDDKDKVNVVRATAGSLVSIGDFDSEKIESEIKRIDELEVIGTLRSSAADYRSQLNRNTKPEDGALVEHVPSEF